MADTFTPRGSSARTGALIFTALSVVFATLGGYTAYRLLSQGGYDREPLRPIVVAVHPIGAGQPLKPDDLTVLPWPASAVPAGSFSDVSALLKPEPAVPTAGFVAGEPILKERLAASDAGPGLAALVSKEARAVAVQVDRSLAASKLVYPGAHVDVIVTIEDHVHNTVVTRTVLEDVRVLAVGSFADVGAARRGSADPNRPNVTDSEAVVTLEVQPPEAEKLAMSARKGKLDLALRNATDRSHGVQMGVALSQLIEGDAPPTSVTPAPPTPVAAAPTRHHASSSQTAAIGIGAPGTSRTFPRQPGSDKKSDSTIEVYSGSAH